MSEGIIPIDKTQLPRVEGIFESSTRKYRGTYTWRTDTDWIELQGSTETRRKNRVDSPANILQSLKDYPEKVAVVKGFNFDKAFKRAQQLGPVIEVAGPTDAYKMRPVRGKELGKMLVSNIINRPHPYSSEPPNGIDYAADAMHLPHPDESVGAVFVANFNPTHLEQETDGPTVQSEFARVLKPGGIAVVQGMDIKQYENAVASGLEPMQMQLLYVIADDPTHQYNQEIMWGILQKPPA